jgi:hypothetical protein
MPGANNGGGGGGGAIRAGRAFVELFAEDNRLYRALDRVKARLQSFGSVTVKIGAAVGAAGLAGLAPLKPAIDGILEGGKLADAADAFGLTGEQASRLFGIMQAGGSDLRDATEGIVTFNQRIEDALNGTGEEAAKLFDGLGKSAEEFQAGNSADRFFKLIDALRQVPDPAKRVQLLLKAVGEDTGKNLIPLLSMSADEVRSLGDAFQQSGADLKAQREASRAYTMAVAGIGRVWREVVVALAPSLKQIAEGIGQAIGPIVQFISQNRETIVTVVAVAAGLAAAGATLVGFGAAMSAAGTAIGAVILVVKAMAAVVLALLSPIGLVVAAVAGLAYVFRDELMEAAKEAWGYLSETFAGVGTAATETWEGIVAAVRKGDLELAFKIAGAGIRAIWAELMLGLRKGWNDFVRWLVGFLKNNPWILPAIGAAVGFAMGGPAGALAGAGAGGLAALAINEFSDEIVRGLSIDLTDATKAVAKARAELRGLVDRAKEPAAGGGPAPDALISPGELAKRQAALVPLAGQRGAFNAAQAAQQFAQGDTFERRQEKRLDAIVKNTADAVRAMLDIGKGLVLR